MGFLTNLAKTVVDVATTPIDVAKDVVTMGGALNDEDEPATLKKLKKLAKDIDELPDSIDEGVI